MLLDRLAYSLTGRAFIRGLIGSGLAMLLLLAGGGGDLTRADGGDGGGVPSVFDGDVRDLPISRDTGSREIPRLTNGGGQESAQGGTAEPQLDPLLAVQASVSEPVGPRAFSTPNRNFEGTSFTGVAPPDTIGDVGPNHYIQVVNTSGGSKVVIYDKATPTPNVLAGPFDLDSLGSGSCATGLGDPAVLYDGLADRWMMSEFSGAANRLCVYVSQTADPVAGGWYGYGFSTPNFPDYPKYAVWPDAYYVSTNESSPTAYALDRNSMLAGLTAATPQRFTGTSLAGFGFQAFIPSDLDGPTAPPAGSPNYFMRHRDTEVHGPVNPTHDILEIWEFHVDWTTPANSSFTHATDILVSEFDSDLCGLVSFFCFPQPGTVKTLDPLREVIMWRLQYRNFGTHETLVGNFVTDVDGTDHGGIRWFELRKSGAGAWALHQEGTYAPDQNHRWMGSIAMDGDGNIALGHSISSTTVFPSIRYTGRLASDTLGTMPQGENSIIAGTGSQTSSTRWGDYSAMSVDPGDDCTFWYTNEYVPASGSWRTRIASFKFDSCGGSPPQNMVGLSPHFDSDKDTVRYQVRITGGMGLTIEGADVDGLVDSVRLVGRQQLPVNGQAAATVLFSGSGDCATPLSNWVTDSTNKIELPDFTRGVLIVATRDRPGGEAYPKDHIVKLSSPGTIKVKVMSGTNNCIQN